MLENEKASEAQEIVARYVRRAAEHRDDVNEYLNPAIYMALQERERALIRWIRTCGIAPLKTKRVMDVGCGVGAGLQRFARMGFSPENLFGCELREEPLKRAQESLPKCHFFLGDAAELPLPEADFDIVSQSTVFSSILSAEFQERLSHRMWSWVKPGGGVLWYDFIYNNPANPDVCGVPLRRVRELFPGGRVKHWRLTLAPPIARRVTKFGDYFYPIVNALPFLRTHVLCWILKEA